MVYYYFPYPYGAQVIFVITLLVGFRSVTSHKSPSCSTVRVAHPKKFSDFVDEALKVLVVFTRYPPPPVQGKPTGRVVIFPPTAPRGAVKALSTCLVGVTGADCNRCLADLELHLLKCKTFTRGEALRKGWCSLRFRQL
ncbi:unnamed protein product [Linum trigynum]|uniref:Gnk2-homologous domain-containing protein n=1 Tax=Linum trigynum TaxID=586398 RepID=A0AAV2F0C5_9ROSI